MKQKGGIVCDAPPLSLGCTSDHSSESDKNAGTDKACNQISEPSAEHDAEERQDEVRDDRANDPEKDVHQHSHVALHEHFGEPAGDTSDDDGGDPANFCVFHMGVT